MTQIPNFADVPLDAPSGADEDRWRSEVLAATGKESDALAWEAPEGIDVQPLYTESDVDGLDFLSTYPGLAPFLRGPYPT
ncbi:methylmalonyl-CoA mutase, partial [Saccharopolyspora karakumensis]